MGQELNSCGTTQIDDKRPLASRTTMRTLWITGRDPVGSYLADAVQAALRSPFLTRHVPHLHHQRLSVTGVWGSTTLPHRFTS